MGRIITAAEKLLTGYQTASEKGAGDYFVRTRPYHSVQMLVGIVIGVDVVAGANIAWVQFPKAQQLNFFDYGTGAEIKTLSGGTRTANLADTNLVRAKSTNGAADFAIEGISLGVRGMRIRYADPSLFSSNDTVQSCLSGDLPLIDPASIASPPQYGSPFNTEVAMYHGLQGWLATELQWDGGNTTIKLGPADMFPDASAKSQMRASGMPEQSNFYTLPEGYLWRKDGKTEGELVVVSSLGEDIIVAINLPLQPGSTSTAVAPTKVGVDICCRLWGKEFQFQGQNG